MVTKGKGESQKTLKICRFQTMDLSSSLVYRSGAEVQETLDFRYFFVFSVTVLTITQAFFYYSE